MKCRHCATPLDPSTDVFLDLGAAPPSNAFLREQDLGAAERHFPLKVLTCPACQFTGHRDLTAAAIIAARLGGGITPAIPADVTHRRAGAHLPGVAPSRRDPRRRAHHRGTRGSPGRHRPARASPT